MQTNEEKQFRLSPQVLIMVAVVLLALTVPVALTVRALQMGLTKPAPEPTTEELGTEPLRQVLEDLAREKLSDPHLDSDRIEVFLTAKDPMKEQARVEALARDLDATALPSVDKNGAVTVLVSIPPVNIGPFLKALGTDIDGGRPSKEQARLWIEIVIAKMESQ